MHIVNKIISVSFGQRFLNVNVLLSPVVIKFHSNIQSKQHKSILNYDKNIILKKVSFHLKSTFLVSEVGLKKLCVYSLVG